MSTKGDKERGGVSIELAILAPVLLAILLLVAVAGRLAGAHTAVDSAAYNAARAASISRTAGEADQQARAAAHAVLSERGMSCPTPVIEIDASALSTAPGQVGSVTVIVTCTVALSDLAIPIGGSRTIIGQASSVVDTYRSLP